MQRFVTCLAVLGAVCLSASETSVGSGPDYQPPFRGESGIRQVPIVMAKSLDNVDMPWVQCGNKTVTVRESGGKLRQEFETSFGIQVNGAEACRIFLEGGYKKGDKWSFGRPFELDPDGGSPKFSVDKANQAVRYTKPYVRPDGKSATFTYRLCPSGEGKVALSWDTGITPEEYATFNRDDRFNLGINFSLQRQYRTAGVTFNGQPYTPLSEQEARKKNSKNISGVTSIGFNSANPLNGFEISLPSSRFVVSESFSKSTKGDFFALYIRSFSTPALAAKGELVIDLMETTPSKQDLYPPVESVDFWGEDAIHYPKLPTQNLLPNSGFEQGLRYWKWSTGGARYTPSEIKRFEAVDGGLFGRKMLVVNPVQHQSMGMASFSLPTEKGRSYTVSYYAKGEVDGGGIRFFPFSTQEGGQYTRSGIRNFPAEKLTTDWKRYSYTIKGDGQMLALWLSAHNRGKVFVDGVQVEKGDQPTDYAAPPVEGYLRTSDSTNNVEYGQAIGAVMEFSAVPGMKAKVELTLRDFYKTELYQGTFSVANAETVDLPFDKLKLGTGVYSLKAKIMAPGVEPYYDYYRFSILKSLNGSHRTKTLFGQLFNSRISRADDYQALIKRYGFGGATTYGPGKTSDPGVYTLREKYGIIDYLHTMSIDKLLTKEQRKKRLDDPDFRFYAGLLRFWLRPSEKAQVVKVRHYTPEILAKVERDVERVARENPYVRVWSFDTEEETSVPAIKEKDFKEYAKLLEAFYRGVKKGNPEALVLPSGGTSGYAAWRGADVVNGMLDATRGKVKWDGVAVHPYGACDKTCGYDDLDESLKLLRDSMAERGYGQDTPMLLTEGGVGTTNTTFKGGNVWDYVGGHLSYDFGLREFVNASRVARGFIICLKYWPQLEHYNIWWTDGSVLLDQELALNAAMNAVNTLGHLLGDPQFVADIRPAPKMRGYAFKNPQGQGVAAVWATSDEVDNGVARGPVMRVKFSGNLPKLMDLMGREWPLVKETDGLCRLQLTAAPLFLVGGEPQTLADDLNQAEVLGTGASIKLAFVPKQSGDVAAIAQNLLNRDLDATLKVNEQSFDAKLPKMQTKEFTVKTGNPATPGKLFKWQGDYTVEQQGMSAPPGTWNMDYFYVPHTEGEPDWDRIPAITMTNLYRPVINTKQTPGGHKGDIGAKFKIAWNRDNLYLRVEAEDDIFNVENKKFWASEQAQKDQLYALDGCLEVYLDCAANGRTGTGGFDLDDYRYDFCVGNPDGKSGPGLANRLREPFVEYALGTEMPTKDEVRQKVKCHFERVSDQKYVYTITLAQRYLEPMRLETGTVAGFALYLHDRMDDGDFGNKGMSLATEPGAHCDNNPKIWPLMMLVK
jgi:hypothetical protein